MASVITTQSHIETEARRRLKMGDSFARVVTRAGGQNFLPLLSSHGHPTYTALANRLDRPIELCDG